MKVKKVESLQEAGKIAYMLLLKAMQQGAHVFGLATGSSPLPLYAYMCDSDVDFSQCIAINLDEYIGLNKEHPQSYATFMHEHLFQYKPFLKTYIPDGSNLDAQQVVAAYETILKTYPIDVQILGIGQNGHIGFNEPETSFNERTHRVALTESTLQANERFFADRADMPTHAYTMGLANIIEAKKIILIACGQAKAVAIKQLLEGDYTEKMPASILQKHPDVTILIDDQAASLLEKTVY